MNKTILAVVLSAFLCHLSFAEQLAEYVENNSEILEQQTNLDNEFVEPEYIESEYDERVYEGMGDISEQDVLLESTANNVLSILASCKEYTLEDGIEEKDLNKYLLICVNNILNENGYKSIKSLPVE